MPFDPDAAAQPGSGLFGLPTTRAEARLVIVPIPFDATTSYGGGAASGPAAVLAASAQVDLFDHLFGRVYEHGLFMDEPAEWIAELSRSARAAAEPIIAKGGADPDDAADQRAIALVNAASRRVEEHAAAAALAVLAEGKTPALLGGDHSTPLGFIRAIADSTMSRGLGILQIDAHMDLRAAFEGFEQSHASIMHNVLTSVPAVARLVQVGIRDYGEGEAAFAREQARRVRVHFDHDLSSQLDAGVPWGALCRGIIDDLPQHVYVSFDIDGLDPALCPNTGTPVPGGLSFNRVRTLLKTLAQSGRHIVGFDLNEVSCPLGAGDWDANVGARILYTLCGAVAMSGGSSGGGSR